MKRLSLVFVVLLISFWACEKENIIESQTTSVEDVKGEDNSTQVNTKGLSGEFCKFTLRFNAKSVTDPITGKLKCEDDLGSVCVSVTCFPDPFIEFEPPLIFFDPCALFPCGIEFLDPWIIYEKFDPAEFGSFRDKLQLKIDPETEAIPFALNKGILGLQFYAPNEMMSLNYGDPSPQPNIFYIERKVTLDSEITKNIGLQGNLIKAGKYPVIFNKENETFNVILAVEEGFYQ